MTFEPKEILSRRIRALNPSPTMAIDGKAKEMKARGINVIGFGVGEPDFDTPEPIKSAAIRALHEGFTKYTPVAGIHDLRTAICEKFKKENGLHYAPDQVVVSNGGKHVLFNLALALFQEGDEVIIPAPYWVTYPDQVQLTGATPVILSTREEDGFLLTPSLLEKGISPKTKAIIMNSPSNPTGAAYDRRQMEEIAHVCVKKGILVISDEIYEHIVYNGFEPVSFAALSPEAYNLTVTVNGLSKSYAMTGWRIGYAAGPKEIIEACVNLQSQSTSNIASFAQKAAIEALNGDQGPVRAMAEEFGRRRKYLLERMDRVPGVRCFHPQGAFYLFPNVSAYVGKTFNGNRINNSEELAQYLLDEARVALVPGEAFGAPGYLRISYAASMEKIKEGMDRIESALKNLG